MKNTKFESRHSKFVPLWLIFFMVVCSLAQPVTAQISTGGSFSLEKSAMPAGGGESAGNGFAITGTAGQSAAGIRAQTGNFSLLGGFWSPDQLIPTAATVAIGGKITTRDGRGIRNVIVTLTDNEGRVRTTFTGSFGIYRFTDVEVGNTYILQVQAKKYSFPEPARVVTVSDELTGLDFTAGE